MTLQKQIVSFWIVLAVAACGDDDAPAEDSGVDSSTPAADSTVPSDTMSPPDTSVPNDVGGDAEPDDSGVDSTIPSDGASPGASAVLGAAGGSADLRGHNHHNSSGCTQRGHRDRDYGSGCVIPAGTPLAFDSRRPRRRANGLTALHLPSP